MVRNRKCRVEFRLNEVELNKLNSAVAMSGLSREEYLRTLIQKIIPANKPTDELVELIKQLRAIGNNMNQIAVIAYKTGSIDVMKYRQSYEHLQDGIIKILEAINEPIKMEEVVNGNNKDMGS